MRLLALVFVFLTGCTVLGPDNELRITEYGGGVGVFTNAEIGGCRIVYAGTIPADIYVHYSGEKCEVIKAGPDDGL